VAIEIKIPKLGMTMEEGKIVEWTKKERDPVQKGEVLLVIESDKVTYEVESPSSGFLAIYVEPGEGIPVGTLVGVLAVSEEEYAAIRERTLLPSSSLMSAFSPDLSSEKAKVQAAPAAPPVRGGPIRATPAARELAKQKRIDLAKICGTGPQGRITREDVLAAVEGGSSSISAAPAAEAGRPAGGPAIGEVTGKRLLKEESMSSMRAAIAHRMMKSLQMSAQMTIFTEWDVTELLKLRALMNRAEVKNGYRATIPGLMVALVARVLTEMPVFNASVEGDTIKYWMDVNIGIAVALPDGLVAPVVYGVVRKSVAEIHRCMNDLISRARQKRLLPDDMANGTFTLTNFGSSGGEWGSVILNPPEVAILGLGRIGKKPIVREDRIEIREMMPASLTVDHRVIDGATAGTFCQRMKELVENPGLVWAEGVPLEPRDGGRGG